MLILGLNGSDRATTERTSDANFHHDASAVLVEDGRVLACVEEERLTRVKHTRAFPTRAVHACLAAAGRRQADVGCVAWNVSPSWAVAEMRKQTPYGPAPEDAADRWARATLRRHLGWEPPRLRFVDHHECHAASAFEPSGYDDALVVSLDGIGDDARGGFRSGGVWIGHGRRLEEIASFSAAQSLGLMYLSLIEVVGFHRFDEYKVMGLAPYGRREVYADLFEEMVTLGPGGTYEFVCDSVFLSRVIPADVAAELAGGSADAEQARRDFAAGLQEMLERIVFHVVGYHAQTTRLRALCLAGGVAHNCTLNGRLQREGGFERMFVQPAAHDAGGALGAAIVAGWDAGAPRLTVPNLFVGPAEPAHDTAIVRERLSAWAGHFAIEGDATVADVAARLEAGDVIGVLHGRSEFGPRALGHRSILADPRPASMKDRINAMVKKREAFRPFAPMVQAERAREFFALDGASATFDFMTYTVPVREAHRAALAAITHVDGTARVQTVERANDPTTWDLLEAFGRRTGFPILLNTSFNNHREPIVETIDDALGCLATTALETLWCEGVLVRKRASASESIGALRLVLRDDVRLVWRASPLRSGAPGARSWALESLSRNEEVALDARLAALIADEGPPIATSAVLDGLDAEGRRRLYATLAELWSERWIRLTP